LKNGEREVKAKLTQKEKEKLISAESTPFIQYYGV
jgi:hypothetical protein